MSEPMTCDNCGDGVSLERTASGSLAVRCDCMQYGVKVAKKLPEGWSA